MTNLSLDAIVQGHLDDQAALRRAADEDVTRQVLDISGRIGAKLLRYTETKDLEGLQALDQGTSVELVDRLRKEIERLTDEKNGEVARANDAEAALMEHMKQHPDAQASNSNQPDKEVPNEEGSNSDQQDQDKEQDPPTQRISLWDRAKARLKN